MQRCQKHGAEIAWNGCWECRRDAEEVERQRGAREFREERERKDLEFERLRALSEAGARVRQAQVAAENIQRNAPRVLAEGESERAKKCLEIGDLEGGLQHARRAVDTDATFPFGRAILAELLHRSGNPAEAQREAERAFRLSSETVADALANFYPPACEFVVARARKRAEEEAGARADIIEREKAAVEARRLATERDLNAHEATELWRAGVEHLWWRALMFGLSFAALACAIMRGLRYVMGREFYAEPSVGGMLFVGVVRGLGAVAVGFVAPALVAFGLARHVAAELQIPGDGSALERRVLSGVVKAGAVFVVLQFGMRSGMADSNLVDAAKYLAPTVIGLLSWWTRWSQLRQAARSSEAPGGEFDETQVDSLAGLYAGGSITCAMVAVGVAMCFGR